MSSNDTQLSRVTCRQASLLTNRERGRAKKKSEERKKKKERRRENSNISFHFGFVVCRFGAASPLSLPLNCGFAADKLRSCPAAELDIFFAHAMPLSFRLSLTSSWTEPRRHICGRLKCLASNSYCGTVPVAGCQCETRRDEGKGWPCSARLIGRPT